MTTRPDVEPQTLSRLRAICLGLPEAHEEQAWVGTRWRIRKDTFAHVLRLAAGWPPAYAQAAGTDGPATLLTFRAPIAKLQSPAFKRAPLFKPIWFADIAGMTIGVVTDWDDVEALLIESYRLLAPKKLAARVEY